MMLKCGFLNSIFVPARHYIVSNVAASNYSQLCALLLSFMWISIKGFAIRFYTGRFGLYSTLFDLNSIRAVISLFAHTYLLGAMHGDLHVLWFHKYWNMEVIVFLSLMASSSTFCD